MQELAPFAVKDTVAEHEGHDEKAYARARAAVNPSIDPSIRSTYS